MDYIGIFLLTLKNISIDVQDNEGNSALHYATKNQNSKLVYNLLFAGANC